MLIGVLPGSWMDFVESRIRKNKWLLFEGPKNQLIELNVAYLRRCDAESSILERSAKL
jgi:hypothetical protein